MTYKILHLAGQELFRLPEIKNFLRISHDYDDAWVMSLLDSCIECAENFLRLCLLPRKIAVSPGRFKISEVRLPIAPIVEITSLKAYKGAKVEDIVKYEISGEVLKINPMPLADYIEIECIAGYSDQRSIPAAIKQGIMLHTAQSYDSHGTDSALSDEVRKLYQPYRRVKI